MGEWGRQTHVLFLFVDVVTKRKVLFVCLPYSAHAIGFRLSLPLLTFSTSEILHDFSVCFNYAAACTSIPVYMAFVYIIYVLTSLYIYICVCLFIDMLISLVALYRTVLTMYLCVFIYGNIGM